MRRGIDEERLREDFREPLFPSVSGLRLLSRPGGRQGSPHHAAAGVFPAAWQPCSTRSISGPVKKEDTPSEDSLDNCQTPSEALLLLLLLLLFLPGVC